MRTLASCEEKGSLSRHSSVLDFFKPSPRTRASPPALLDTDDDDDTDDCHTIKEGVPAE